MANKYQAQELEDVTVKLSTKIEAKYIYVVPTYKLENQIKTKTKSLLDFKKPDKQVNSGIRYNLKYLGNVISINKDNINNKMPNMKEFTTNKEIKYLHEIEKKKNNSDIYTKAKDIQDLKSYLSQYDLETLNNLDIQNKKEYTIFEIAKIYNKLEKLNKRNINEKNKILKKTA